MQKSKDVVQRNTPRPNMITPDTLENTRDPSEYTDAVVKERNERYGANFMIDPAKAKLISVRQNSFKPWLATVQLGEDLLDEDGKIIATNIRSTEITREEHTRSVFKVTRVRGEDPYVTWGKVAEAAGLDRLEIIGLLDLSDRAHQVEYPINPMSLNLYGVVKVRFEYEEPETEEGDDQDGETV